MVIRNILKEYNKLIDMHWYKKLRGWNKDVLEKPLSYEMNKNQSISMVPKLTKE